jgi:Cd2+/Zn2+-exporting ATPase
MLLQWLKLGPVMLHTICYAVATLAGGLLVAPAAFKALKKLRLDMNVLMTVAVTGAWLVGEGAEGAAVVFLFACQNCWSPGASAERGVPSPRY